MLTEHQKQKLEEGLSYLEKGDRLLIRGSAGTGKTYLCNELVKNLLPIVKNYIYCTAPTNKAVSVLQSKISVSGKIAFMSTHAALKMRRIIDEKTGEVSFKPMFNENFPPLQNVSVLIVDEASMVNKELLEYIEEWATIQKCKVIFLMDHKQLPPVNEDEMPVLEKNYLSIELLEIIRQKDDNPIIDLSFNLNKVKDRKDNLIRKETEEGVVELNGYVFSNDFNKIIDKLILSCGTDLYKYGAYTNEEVNKINALVRYKLYENPQRIETGETMIFDAPYGKNYSTNQEIKIKKYVILQKDFVYLPDTTVNLKYYLINYFESEDVYVGGIMVLHENSDIAFKEAKRHIKDAIKEGKSDWINYYNFVEQFAQLKYAHAFTIHKMQGSTFQNVILNIMDMKKCRGKEYKNLLYTGLTRASKMVVLYNS